MNIQCTVIIFTLSLSLTPAGLCQLPNHSLSCFHLCKCMRACVSGGVSMRVCFLQYIRHYSIYYTYCLNRYYVIHQRLDYWEIRLDYCFLLSTTPWIHMWSESSQETTNDLQMTLQSPLLFAKLHMCLLGKSMIYLTAFFISNAFFWICFSSGTGEMAQ